MDRTVTHNFEDPAIIMARKLLHNARREFIMSEREEIKKRTMTVTCSVCGKRVPKSGTSFQVVDGKRIFTCPDCSGSHFVKQEKTAALPAIRNIIPSRKTCFFCNNDMFHLNMDNSFQCASCGSIFFKGPIK